MQAKTDAQAAETTSLLESFSMELSAGGLLVMTDFAKAESAYIHHSRVPVAVVARAAREHRRARFAVRRRYSAEHECVGRRRRAVAAKEVVRSGATAETDASRRQA